MNFLGNAHGNGIVYQSVTQICQLTTRPPKHEKSNNDENNDADDYKDDNNKMVYNKGNLWKKKMEEKTI